MSIDTPISIAGRRIPESDPPYVIAEISANHNGSIDTARKIIAAAKAAGADAVKLQTYRPDTITLKSDLPDFKISMQEFMKSQKKWKCRDCQHEWEN